MMQKNETKPIIEKYKKLNEACAKNEIIVLGDEEHKPKLYKEISTFEKNGFIEKFCKIHNWGSFSDSI